MVSTAFSQAYLVCATPRSGSTLLCELLRATGRAGNPAEHFEFLRHSSLPRQPREYFDALPSPEILDVLPPLQPGAPSHETPEVWWTRISREGTSGNGVWGGKIMWGHVDDFLARARELPGLAGADLDAAVRALLGDPLLVFITRGDKVSQAISLWRAVQTQTWRSSPTPGAAKPSYSYAGIDHLAARLQQDEEAWSAWFKSTGRVPLRLGYEEIEQDPRAAARGVLRALGLSDAGVPAPELARQRDALSAEWAHRFHVERERAA